MKKYLTKKTVVLILMAIAMVLMLAVPCFATTSATDTTAEGLDEAVSPVIELLNKLLKPLIAVIAAVGTLYCVVLGVKYARAEEPQDREKAKQHLKSAIIGFILIFVLMVVLNGVKEPLLEWAQSNMQ